MIDPLCIGLRRLVQRSMGESLRGIL